jgi:heme exporter protein A
VKVVLSQLLLEAREVSCERDHRLLFERVSFTIAEGQVLQIAGANGSGKTTLLRFLGGISRAFSGDILWCGRSIRDVATQYRSQFLYLGHAPGVSLNLSPLENLRWYFSLNQHIDPKPLEYALHQVGLAGYEDVPAYRMSAGQQRRIALARLIVSQAPLWILDEPFTAIDRHGVAELEQLLARHAHAGGGVVLTTHHALNLDTPFVRVELESDPC